MRRPGRSFYRSFSLGLVLVFTAVGAAFLLLPEGVIRFMNSLARFSGMAPSPPAGHHFYLILAVGYMSAVTCLAWLMFRNPGRVEFPLLLAQAKLSSSILSFGFLVFHRGYFIYLANGIVDGLIGIAALALARGLKRAEAPKGP